MLTEFCLVCVDRFGFISVERNRIKITAGEESTPFQNDLPPLTFDVTDEQSSIFVTSITKDEFVPLIEQEEQSLNTPRTVEELIV